MPSKTLHQQLKKNQYLILRLKVVLLYNKSQKDAPKSSTYFRQATNSAKDQ